ncbi:wd domaincontaining protein [Stylonychia lemnae]|uniref:Wd domaincontaining protein n=1 Tax=Stylonychia lemnae TaxID=5949 RepID=A0A077ZYS2_STYLE|nr:wd domaincontaining protein [Stylonychia lemnae]|eukprot:CDW75055.1 wd domaincontaining protein [Stylonychia lemnae]
MKQQQASAVIEDKAKRFQETLIKFSDLLIASTSSQHEEINFWEPKTLAPYEPLTDKKFYAAANTLCVNSGNYVLSSHTNKTTINVWRWDKKEPFLRFPLKEELSVLKQSQAFSGSICIGGSKTGRIYLWQIQTGQLIGELEAHYMGISDLEASTGGDMLITGGKDGKVKVWIMEKLFSSMIDQNTLMNLQNNQNQNNQCIVEFGDHTSEVTQVAFSLNNPMRCFSCSIDKLFKVYDISAKCVIKNIQLQSPIHKFVVDSIESYVYLACENQNIYCYSMELSQSDLKSKHKKTLQHKKKVTALCLTFDGQYLVSGDQSGLIYIWNIASADFHQIQSNVASPRNGAMANGGSSILNQKSELIGVGSQLLQTFELHRDKGAITNLQCIYRPLSLYGLTANMKAYEPVEIKSFQNHIEQQDEMDYLIRSSQRIFKPDATNLVKNQALDKLKNIKSDKNANEGGEDFIGVPDQNKEVSQGDLDGSSSLGNQMMFKLNQDLIYKIINNNNYQIQYNHYNKMRASFYLNYVSGLMRKNLRGIMRYSGEYNILIFTFGLIYFDHYLENKIRRDLQRLITLKRQVERLKEEAPPSL